MERKSTGQAAAKAQRASAMRCEALRQPQRRAGAAPTNFLPVRRRRTFEEICQRIREQLARGTLKPGDKLPAERDFAQKLGVSRNVLREALRSLEMAGVLTLRKGVKGGAFIRDGDTSRMNDVMRDMLSLGTISVDELGEARISILDLVVRLACTSAQRAEFDALEDNIDRTELATREGRLLDRVECSREFYRLLGAATRNQVIAMILHSVTEIHMRFVYAKVASSGASTPHLVLRRRQLLDAIRARNAEKAGRLMRAHLQMVHRMLKADPGAMALHVALAEMQPGSRV